VRLYSTVVLIAAFLATVWAGHVPLALLIFGIQTVMVRELFALARVAQRERRLRGFRAQQWYFYLVAAFWTYVRYIKRNLAVELTSSAAAARLFGWLLRRHALVSFSLYCAGFVAFVLSLEKDDYLYQFGQFAWTHMILLTVFLPSSFFVALVFDGIAWFLLPTALVIVNDIAAYLAGFFLGRTPLIKLSPKKTWEGFVGGAALTVLASWALAEALSRHQWLTCPRTDLSVFRPLECAAPPDVFRPRPYGLEDALGPAWPAARALLAATLPDRWAAAAAAARLSARPAQFHAVALAVFASAIAPFGGFFASGFKRGFKIKDFGDSIPGHGGMTDRMDCQVVMAGFAYLYYHAFIDASGPTVGSVLGGALRLAPAAQLELLERLANVLVAKAALPEALGGAIAAHVAGGAGVATAAQAAAQAAAAAAAGG
jgi:phosphatidate cytidylyltransferase